MKKRKADMPKHTDLCNSCIAKVGIPVEACKDLIKVLQYFRYTVGTTLDCSLATGVLRNCITWYVRDLERGNLLQAICRKRDRTTGFMAKHYTADRSLWRKPSVTQLKLFGKEV